MAWYGDDLGSMRSALYPENPLSATGSPLFSKNKTTTTTMENLGSELAKLTPEQRQAIMMQAQQEANQSVMQEMMKQMTLTCFQKCAGTSVCISILAHFLVVYFSR